MGNAGEKAFAGFMLAWVLLCIAVPVATIAIVIHFVLKYW